MPKENLSLSPNPMSIDPDRDLRWGRRLSFVPRWGVLPTIRRQSVAEHCFHVARTAMWLLQFVDPNFKYLRSDTIELALCHDDEEAVTGDHPSPRKDPKPLKSMNSAEVIVKVADILEGMAFLHEEAYMGNRHGIMEAKSYMLNKLDIYWEKFPWQGPDKPRSEGILVRYLNQIVSLQFPHPVLEL